MTAPNRHCAKSQSQRFLPAERLGKINEDDEEDTSDTFFPYTYHDTSRLIKRDLRCNELSPTYLLPTKEKSSLFPTRILVLIAITLSLCGAGASLLMWWKASSDSVCPCASDPVHGKASCTDATGSLKGKCKFSCDDGYALSGEDTVICTDGKCSNKPPICVSECAPLSPLAHGEITCTNHYTINSVCTFTCRDNHLLEGNASTKCQANATWSNPEPVCVCPQCYVGYRCEDSISWEDVDKVLNPMQAYGTITVNYGEQVFSCTTELHSITIKWTGKCTDKETQTMAKCDHDYVSPRGSAKHAAAQLIRILTQQKKYPEPCDPQRMPTGC